MSTGIVVCSICSREVHQSVYHKWTHCEDATPLCPYAERVYPKSTDEIKGAWCGSDGSPRERAKAKPTASVKTRLLLGKPVVKFTRGSFKSFQFEDGQFKRVR